MEKLPDISRLPEGEDRKKLITQTLIQIQKDFQPYADELWYDGDIDNAYESILAQLSDLVALLLQREAQNFMNILYRVDISDKRFKNILDNAADTPNELADAIIKREFQKVWIRLHFSS